ISHKKNRRLAAKHPRQDRKVFVALYTPFFEANNTPNFHKHKAAKNILGRALRILYTDIGILSSS
ncbi:MAG: hypothetical protein FWG82_02665, partial [Oscillospiraceae bacterium]|nr:hypothetical protein [Oscillospiraceae bacterium]